MGPITHARRQLRRDDDETGAELVEFAIIVVLLIALVYGIVFFGVMLASKVSLTQAAADGARSGITYSTASSAILQAEDRASQDLSWLGRGSCVASVSNPNPIISCVATEAPCVDNTSNTCLTMTVDYTNYAANGLIPGVLGLSLLSPSNIQSQSTLQVTTPTS